MGQSLFHREACATKKFVLLETRTGITNWSKSYYKVGQVIYYKVGQSLLQSGEGIILQSGATITEKVSTSS